MKIAIEGLEKARAMLKKTLTLSPALEKSLTAITGERLRVETFRRTPVRSGALRASGQVSVSGENIHYINPRDYSWYVELGTGIRGSATWEDFYGRSRLEKYWPQPTPEFSKTWPGMEAQPYIRPAIVVAMGALVNNLRALAHEELK